MTLGLAIVGYGKMGRLVAQLAPEYGFDVRAKFDSKNNAGGAGLTRFDAGCCGTEYPAARCSGS